MRRTHLVSTSIFALALALTTAGVRRGIESVPGARIEATVRRQQEKYVFWEQSHADYDLVFVGSSRLYRELSPYVVDGVLGTLGHPVKSFNFGLPGMGLPETLHTVDWLLSFDTPGLGYVVIEWQEPDPKLKPDNRFTRRSLGWHSPKMAWLAARAVLRDPERGLLERIEGSAAHGLVALGHAGNIGNGLKLASHLLGYDEEPEFNPRYNGWWPLEAEADSQHGQRRRRLAEERELLESRIAALASAPRSTPPDDFTARLLRSIVERVRAAGAEPIFLVPPPTHLAHAMLRGAFEQGLIPNLFAYNDPAAYPEFYDPESFYDLAHLDLRGSSAFSDRFARDLARYLDGRP